MICERCRKNQAYVAIYLQSMTSGFRTLNHFYCNECMKGFYEWDRPRTEGVKE